MVEAGGFEILWIKEEYEEPVTLYIVSSKKTLIRSGIVGYYNMARVVISTLIKERNEKQAYGRKKWASHL